MIGLTQNSEQKELIINRDENTAIKYKVTEEVIDLGLLRIEKQGLQEQLDKILTDEELLAWAKENYEGNRVDQERLEARLAEINSILGQ
jgi:predicted transcriptional regulator